MLVWEACSSRLMRMHHYVGKSKGGGIRKATYLTYHATPSDG
jgi:hypothetical protein